MQISFWVFFALQWVLIFLIPLLMFFGSGFRNRPYGQLAIVLLVGIVFLTATWFLFNSHFVAPIVILFLSVVGQFWVWGWLTTDHCPLKLVTVHNFCEATTKNADTLVVLIHGAGGPGTMDDVRDAVLKTTNDWGQLDGAGAAAKGDAKGADLLTLSFGNYPWRLASNSKAEHIAQGISQRIQMHCDVQEKNDPPKFYQRIVLVGHSMGSLIVRKAFVVGMGRAGDIEHNVASPWAKRVRRVVLLAGMNRGWSIEGNRPLDMGWGRHMQLWASTWLGHLSGTGGLARSTENGAPFVANLRLQWMTLCTELAKKESLQKMPSTVQLLGDIDDMVSDADNMDLRVAGSFGWLRVRGTGHGDILNFKEGSQAKGDETKPKGCDSKSNEDSKSKEESKEVELGQYRKDKFLLALTQPFAKILMENEEQPYTTDAKVKHVVFVLHGIRDLGQWSSVFEQKLQERYRELNCKNPDDKLIVHSPRYGYFGMGNFLLRSDRQKYVRWFMDQYTETLARYPKLERIDFVGHSNGTYLLASALDQYRELKVDRVVFGGSVVERDYNWQKRFDDKQVEQVRNYVAKDDWVVALFPRFFEIPVLNRFNDLGSGGFNGFDFAPGVPGEIDMGMGKKEERRFLQNIGYISGGHSAFLEENDVASIVNFLLPKDRVQPAGIKDDGQSCAWWWASKVGFIFVWLAIVLVVVVLGIYLTRGAKPYTFYVAIGYAMFVLWLLRKL